MNIMMSQIIAHSTVCLTAYMDPHKKTSNSPETGEFPAQGTSNAEKSVHMMTS